MAEWTITASSRMEGADWSGHLRPQVVKADSLVGALAKAREIPLRDWLSDDQGQVAVEIKID